VIESFFPPQRHLDPEAAQNPFDLCIAGEDVLVRLTVLEAVFKFHIFPQNRPKLSNERVIEELIDLSGIVILKDVSEDFDVVLSQSLVKGQAGWLVLPPLL